MNSSSPHELVQLLQQFGQASDRYVESTGALHRTHRTDMNALAIIMRYQAAGRLASPRDLSRELQLSSPATTAMLDRMERLGYIERQRTDKDRRVVRIAPTDLARSNGRAMFQPLGTKMLEVISRYSEQERELLGDFMRRAIAGVDAAREDNEAHKATPRSG